MNRFLPFKVKPQSRETVEFGNRDIGILEIEKYGDLLINERIYIAEKISTLPDIQLEVAKLAQKIANQTDLNIVEAYTAIASNQTEILAEYIAELLEIQKLMEEVSLKKKPILATAIIKYRIDSQWELEDTKDGKKIHPLLVDKVAEFAKLEESRWLVFNSFKEEENLKKS